MKRVIALGLVIATATVGGVVAVATTVGAATASTAAATDACGDGPVAPAGPRAAVGGQGAALAATAARAAGFTAPDLVMAVAIAGAESSYRPTVRNSIGASGLWQILESAHPDLFTKYDWRDPAQNALRAHSVWTAAHRSWNPWTTFTSGAYRSHLNEARAAVAALPSTPTTSGAKPTAPSNNATTPSVSSGGSTPKNAAGSDASSPPVCSPAVGGLPHAPRPFTGPDGYADDPTSSGRITRRTLHTYNEINRSFGGWRWGIGCWDPHPWNPTSDHPKGTACDFVIGEIGTRPTQTERAIGWQLARWLERHASALGISYLIWDGRIWSAARSGEGWRPYGGGGIYDPRSVTGGHRDHVHVST